MVRNIRDYQEAGRAISELLLEVKDDIEDIERLGDGDEYKATLKTKLFEIYNKIDDLGEAFDEFVKLGLCGYFGATEN